MSNHSNLINLLRSKYDEDPIFFIGSSLFLLNDEDLARSLFSNYRKVGDKSFGYRVSNKDAIAVLSYYFDSYKIPISDFDNLSNRHILYVDSQVSTPWHIMDSGYITFFEKEIAMRAKLAGSISILMNGFT